MTCLKGFYFITDHKLSINGNIKDVDLALQAGVSIIQFREKHRKIEEYFNELIKIKALCKNKAKLIVNDSLELAKEIDADGIHVGQNDTPIQELKKTFGNDKLIGISVNTPNQAVIAQKEGASYIAIGHIFPTKTKEKSYLPIGIETIIKIRQLVSIPIVAIGGINIYNAKSVVNTGINMICAISDSLKYGSVKENIEKYINLFN
ncbi:MAG: thiamine phosphate synthase [Spirochaetota bacterium]|nr:thiamine phosphate synthase [Spirochaetota bacterium]